MTKLKHPISCKALTKPPKDQKPPPFIGGFVPNKPTQNKVYSFDLTKVDALFDEMLLHKAIVTPHQLSKPEELNDRQYCRWHNSWNHSTNSCVVFMDVIQEGIIVGRLKLAENMVNLNWSEQKRGKLIVEASTSKGRRVIREANQRPKATISARVVLCSKCKCESELEVTLDRQNQPAPSVFDRIGTSHQHGPVPAPPKDRARQKDYIRPA
ncbi:unnamed protein product [Prunus armeniaca]